VPQDPWKGRQVRFEPNWQFLVSGYHTSAWFRDAKFGIWAHWSAQCVPEDGDWYARGMYDSHYEHNLRTDGRDRV